MSARENLPTLVVVALSCNAVVAVAAALVVRSGSPFPELPPEHTSHVEARPTPNVLLAVRELSRLEGSQFHMERVVELSDDQTRLFGLVKAKDAILLVAVGDVTAGVDLAKLDAKDVSVDASRKRAVLRLASPEVFSAAIDNAKTHVYSRTTDHLAARREDLEGLARTEAETGMRKAAVEGGILDKTRASVERTLRALLAPLGFDDVAIEWKP